MAGKISFSIDVGRTYIFREINFDSLLDFIFEYLDALQDRGRENVDSSIDLVGDKDFWFLHKAIDFGRVGMIHDNTVLGGLFDFGDQNGALTAVFFVVGGHFGKGKVANDIRVEDIERLAIFS